MQKVKERKIIKHKDRIFIIAVLFLTIGIYLYFLNNNKAKNEQFQHYPPIETVLIERTERLIERQALRDDQLGLYIYDLTSDDQTGNCHIQHK